MSKSGKLRRLAAMGRRLELEWHDVRKPRRWHRCWPQSRAWGDSGTAKDYFSLIERCPCGAVRGFGGGKWKRRNARPRRLRRPFTPRPVAEPAGDDEISWIRVRKR